jgi:hypothetical protein
LAFLPISADVCRLGIEHFAAALLATLAIVGLVVAWVGRTLLSVNPAEVLHAGGDCSPLPSVARFPARYRRRRRGLPATPPAASPTIARTRTTGTRRPADVSLPLPCKARWRSAAWSPARRAAGKGNQLEDRLVTMGSADDP